MRFEVGDEVEFNAADAHNRMPKEDPNRVLRGRITYLKRGESPQALIECPNVRPRLPPFKKMVAVRHLRRLEAQ